MRIRLTLRSADLPDRDVVVDAPLGTSLSSARDALAGHGLGPTTPLWSGRRVLPGAALFGGPGLREGSVVHVERPAPAEPAAAVVHLDVVGGPDAGLSVPVPRGVLGIGRGPDCDVRLSDPDVSRVHAELTVTASGISLRDLDSTNGTVLVGDGHEPDVPVDRDGIAVPLGAVVRLGDTVVQIGADASPGAVTGLDADGRTTVNRPPRLPSTAPTQIVLPEPARRRAAASVPWLAAVLPALVGGGLAWSMHNTQFLAFALLSPVMLLGGAVGERLTGRRRRRRTRRAERAELAAARASLATALVDETRTRRLADPDPATVARIARGPGTRLWERRPADADAARVRVGVGDRPADPRVRCGTSTQPPRILPLVPVTVDLRRGSLGLCGPPAPTAGLARWVLTQLVTARSPVNLNVVVLASDDRADAWRWTRWLPHLTLAARDDSARRAVVGDLVDGLDRVRDRTPTAGTPVAVHTVVVVDRARLVAELPGLDRVVAEGPASGVAAICVEDDRRRLPPGCGQVAELVGDTGTRVCLGARDDRSPVIADRVPAAYAERLARALAPLVDPTGDPDAGLPSAVRLLDVLELGRPDPLDLADRWAAATDGRPQAPVAVGPDGPVTIDLDRDGPHTLVAGTTGSGKSELLQTLVAGIAAGADPDAVRFVLIDYKGGAAFADCADLPHVAGVVTDLDAHLTRRALTSLEAELRRRETLFAAAGVADLAAYRRRPRHGAPLGRLVIVVDEFAALAEELPEFVTGLVGVAQRGRSLGVHLVLATQRPGGAVSPEIRANTALRIALRVTDAAESLDVVGIDHAAAIDPALPGRAVLRIGERTVTVQTARVGGPAPAGHADAVTVRALTSWGESLPGERPAADAKTDLRLLVDAAREAAARRGYRPPDPPWLDPLPDLVPVGSVPQDAGPDRRAIDPPASTIVLGLADRPTEQRRTPWALDLSRGGTLLVAGGPRSGRTTLLRTLALQAVAAGPQAVHLYVADCAGGSLRPLATSGACGAVITRDDPETLDRLLARLSGELARRHAALGGLGAGSAAEARAAGHDWPALVLLVDGWTGFVEAVERIDAGRPADTLLALLREAPAVGLTVVITGDRSCLTGTLAGVVEQRLVLRLADPADYPLAGLSPRDVPRRMPAGRALDADATEIQVAVLGADPSPAAQWRHLVADPSGGTGAGGGAGPSSAGPSGAGPCGGAAQPNGPFRLRPLPARVPLAGTGAATTRRPGSAVLGAGGDDAGPAWLELSGAARILVAGPARSGRSTTLTLLAGQTVGERPVVCAAPPRSGLAQAAIRMALPRLAPADAPHDVLAALAEPGTLLLVDDVETFADTDAGEALTGLVRDRDDLAVVLAGRNDELALSFRGVGAEVRRHRCGLLLDPQPGDGDLLGIRLPVTPGRSRPPGRAVAVLGDRLQLAAPTDRTAVDVQIALPVDTSTQTG